MASASYSAKLSESKYTNWVKAGLAVHFTKEGIEPFVKDVIEEFQQKCLNDICKNNSLLAGSTCSSCCTENVVVCPTKRICYLRHRTCGFHRNPATQYRYAGCPNRICHNFKHEIQSAHRFFGPSYKNTDTTQWCSNSWEVAKCFMPPDGYKDVTSAAETDFNGINSVIINCKSFQPKINDNLGVKNNIFEKGRNIGRAVRHSPTLEVEDSDLQQYFTDLQTLLSDSGYLKAHPAAQNARKKLREIQNDTIIIDREDIKKVLDDVAKIVQNRIQSEGDKQQNKLEDKNLELIKEMKIFCRTQDIITMSRLTKIVASALSNIEESAKESIEKINTKTEKVVKAIEEETERGKRKIVTTADEATKKTRKILDETITKATDGALVKIKEGRTATEEEIYNKLKQDLQADLITYYRETCRTIPVSPALEECEVCIFKVYIPSFPMYSLETDKLKQMLEKRKGNSETKIEVESLSKIFCQRSKLCKNVYMTAEPGAGKTSFVKWTAQNWCQAHCPVNEDGAYFQQIDVDQMKTFEFLFVIFLREMPAPEIDSMIETLITKLAGQIKYTPEVLERILREQNCLIVLDGLDEWSSSDSAVRIPKRKAREKCTYLTTSRPWKFCTLPLNSTQIDQHIQIRNESELCADKLLPKVFQLFKERECLTDDVTDVNDACQKFRNVLNEKKLTHFHDKPLIYIQLVYLWNMTGRIGSTQIEIYRDMIEDIFAVSERKTQLPGTNKSTSSAISNDLMLKLGKLAFETLFSENKETSLVFDETVTFKCLQEDEKAKSEDILSACLQTGLLSRQVVYVGARKKKYTYSFYHKTIQEYIAAQYALSTSKDEETAKKVHERCTSLSDVLEMGTFFTFLSGLDTALASALLKDLQAVISNDAATIKFRSKYFSRDDEEYRKIKAVQNLLVTCVTESKDNGQVGVEFTLEDVFVDSSTNEDSYASSLKRLIYTNKHNIYSLNISSSNMNNADFACSDFRLSNIQSVCTLNVDTKHTLNELHCLLERSTTRLKGLSSGQYASPNETLLKLEVVDTITDVTYLETLCLHGTKLPNDKLKKFVQYIEQQIHLRYLSLYLDDNRMNDNSNQTLTSLKLNLSGHNNLQEVTLSIMPLSNLILNNELKLPNLQCIPLKELEINEKLQHLELYEVQLTRLQLHGNLETLDLNRVSLSELDGNLTSLKYCTLSELSAGVPSGVFRRLPVTLRTLIWQNSRSYEEVASLLDTIPNLTHIEEVEICNADFGYRSLNLQPDMKQLERVDLAGVSLTDTSFQILVNTVLKYEQKVCLEFKRLNLIIGNRKQRQLTSNRTLSVFPTATEDCSRYDRKTVEVHRSTIAATTYIMLVDTLLKCEQYITLVFAGVNVKGNAGISKSVSQVPQNRGNISNSVDKYIRMDGVQIEGEVLQYFLNAVEGCQYLVSVMLNECFEEGSFVRNNIKSSSSFITTWYGDDRLDLSNR